jgi:hypothetical protein
MSITFEIGDIIRCDKFMPGSNFAYAYYLGNAPSARQLRLKWISGDTWGNEKAPYPRLYFSFYLKSSKLTDLIFS